MTVGSEAVIGGAGPVLVDDVFGGVLGAPPRRVRDRSMSAEATALLQEWFAPRGGGGDAGAGGNADGSDGTHRSDGSHSSDGTPRSDGSHSRDGTPEDVAADPSGVTPEVAAAPAHEPVDGPASAAWSAPVRALVDAVAAVRAQVATDLPGPQAVTEAEVLLQQLEVLRSVALTRIADVDRRDLHTLADAPSTGTWVAAQQTSLTRTEVALARRLAAFPAVQTAVDTGSLSVAVAARVAGALVKARPHVDRPDGLIDDQPAEATVTAVVVDGVLGLVCQARGGMADDDPLLQSLSAALIVIAEGPRSQLDRLTDAFVLLARHVEPGDLPGALGQLLDALLPDELERRAQDAHDQRGFRMRLKDDGSGWLVTRGDLDLECGELLTTVLTAELAVDPDNPVDTAAYCTARDDGWTGLDDLPDDRCGGPRSLDQRRHDALRNGLRRYLDSGIAGLRDKIAPHLAVTVSLQALHDAPGALPPVAASAARLPRSLVRAWWCDSAITRFVLGLGHKVIELSHTERTLKPHERRAKRIETGGRCQGSGCCRGPGTRLVPHHPHAWATTGTTSLTDSVLLCEHTHTQLHHGRTIRLKDGRRLGPHGWLPPDTG